MKSGSPGRSLEVAGLELRSLSPEWPPTLRSPVAGARPSGQLRAAGLGLDARAPPLPLGPPRNLLGQRPGRATGTTTRTGERAAAARSGSGSSGRLEERPPPYRSRTTHALGRRAAEGGLGTWESLGVKTEGRGGGAGQAGRGAGPPRPTLARATPTGRACPGLLLGSSEAVSSIEPLDGQGQGARARGYAPACWLGGLGSETQGVAEGKMPPFPWRNSISGGRF